MIFTGGGKIAREYQQAGKKINLPTALSYPLLPYHPT